MTSRPSLVIEQESPWRPITRFGSMRTTGAAPIVKVDVFGPNPMVEAARKGEPQRAAKAGDLNGPAPTLFAAGDLPLFTASDLDPQLLLQLPWVLRHAAASMESRAEVARLFEDYSTPDLETWEAAWLASAMLDGGDLRGTSPNVSYTNRVVVWGTIDPDDRLRMQMAGRIPWLSS